MLDTTSNPGQLSAQLWGSRMSELSVIVTGGASGIGAAAARKIVAAGGHAGILDLNAAAAAALAQELGPRAAAASADMLDEAAVTAAHDALARACRPLRAW